MRMREKKTRLGEITNKRRKLYTTEYTCSTHETLARDNRPCELNQYCK